MQPVPLLGRIGFAGFCTALALLVLAGLATRFGLISYVLGVRILLPIALSLGLAALAASIVWQVLWLRHAEASEQRYGLIALIGSVAMLFVPLYDYVSLKTLPPLYDISTDVAHPPAFDALLPLRKGAENKPDYDGARLITFEGKTKTAAEWQRKQYTAVHTLQLLTPPATLYKRALKGARLLGWHIVAESAQSGRIEAVDQSLLFGFPSDIVVRVRPSGAGAKLDARAESRMGQHDAGRNAGLLRAYLLTVAKRT